MRIRWCLLMAMIFSGMAFADITELPEPPAKTDKLFGGINFSGYLDTSLNYLIQSNHFTSGIIDRTNDLEPNGFTLHQLAITLTKQPPEGFGGVFHGFIGRDAFNLASYGFNPSTGVVKNIGYDIPQAFLQYAKKSWVVMVGEFYSQAGIETDNPTQDTNFSRNIISGFIEPGSLLGARATYVVNNKFSVYGGVNNGWDNIADTSRAKTLELGAAYTTPFITYSMVIYSGSERAGPRTSMGPVGRRTLIDFFTIINATDKLSFIVNYDYFWQMKAALPNNTIAKALAQGIAGYINYKFNDKLQTSLRAEMMYDQNGFVTGVRQNWREITLTLGITPIKNLEFRFETRRDLSNVASFAKKSGGGASNNNQSFAVEGLFKF